MSNHVFETRFFFRFRVSKFIHENFNSILHFNWNCFSSHVSNALMSNCFLFFHQNCVFNTRFNFLRFDEFFSIVEMCQCRRVCEWRVFTILINYQNVWFFYKTRKINSIFFVFFCSLKYWLLNRSNVRWQLKNDSKRCFRKSNINVFVIWKTIFFKKHSIRCLSFSFDATCWIECCKFR